MTVPAISPEYKQWLASLTDQIRNSRARAALAVNSEMIMLYWRIGREIMERQDRHIWGAKIIDRLAADLRAEFPDIKGFSARNLQYMRTLAAEWPDPAITQQVVAQFYLAAVDDQLRTDGDNQSIGLILCRGKNGLVVEYALQDMNKPMAVSEYTVLPPDLANALPSSDILEAGLEDHLGSVAVIDDHDDGDGGGGGVSKGP